VKKILITHPAATFVHYSVDDMKEILDLGATFLEHTWNDVTRQVSHRWRSLSCSTSSRLSAPPTASCPPTRGNG